MTLHESVFPVLTQRLTALSNILDKAEADASARKYDSTILVQARLAPDMFAFARQVQIACDFAKGCAARLAGITNPSKEDKESSLAELQARIRWTLDFIGAVTLEHTAGAETRRIQLKLGGRELDLDGATYVRDVVFPHFYFHLTMAYAILRHNGVNIGKQDFIG